MLSRPARAEDQEHTKGAGSAFVPFFFTAAATPLKKLYDEINSGTLSCSTLIFSATGVALLCKVYGWLIGRGVGASLPRRRASP